MNKKELPTAHDLIILAREYSDEETMSMGSDAPGFDYQILEQKQFIKIIKWLTEKGY